MNDIVSLEFWAYYDVQIEEKQATFFCFGRYLIKYGHFSLGTYEILNFFQAIV